jgi:hypothetical protein
MKRFTSVFVAAVLGWMIVAPLAQAEDEKYFTIGSVEFSEVLREYDDSPMTPSDLGGDLGGAVVILDQVVNLGQKMWKLVEENKPVVDWKEPPRATALPKGLENWTQLQGWQNPQARVYRVAFKNLYGVEVVNFKYRVSFTPGGNLKGKGGYLANVSVVPAELSVAWGYKFNASAEVAEVLNAGTQEAPVAGLEVLVRWQVDTVLKHDRGTGAFFVRGDGGYKDLTRGEK